MEDKIHSQDEKLDARDVILDLNFVPQWARKPPGKSHYGDKAYTRDQSPRRDVRQSSRREGRRDDRSRRPREERSQQPRTSREPVKELPVSVTFLPEQKRLASLVRQIHHSRRAYPLMDLANLLIHDPEGYLVKIEVNKENSDFEMFQCKQCKAISSTEEGIVQHIMSKHLTDFYDKEVLEVDPPSGSFPGVARCRKTGILLGPPNHHSYSEKLTELHQAHFAHLSLDEYKSNVEIVKDEEVIEQWKDEMRKQIVYKLKSDAEAEPVPFKKAEVDFSKKVPGLYSATRRAVFPATVAQKLEDSHIVHAIRGVWSKESRFPLTMSFSMRAAFRHMHLYMFKAGKVNFVT
ncbi:MAG TPA: hypothetical protein VIR63_01405, partial [Pontiella sp.]